MTADAVEPSEVITNDDPDSALCTLGGVAHDYRPHTYEQSNRTHTSCRCVWCHVVACGDYADADPCMEPYHHDGPHRSRLGIVWPKGADRG